MKLLRKFGASLLSIILLTTSATAETASLTANVSSANIGFEYRAEYEHHNHGLLKEPNINPSQTSTIQLKALNFKLNGEVNERTSYFTRINLLNFESDLQPIEYAKFTWRFIEWAQVGIGQDQVNQGGFAVKTSSYKTIIESPYTQRAGDLMPFEKYSPVISLHFNLGYTGQITLQFINEVKTNIAQYKTVNKQPANTLEYTGSFGAVRPLLQFGTYDVNHSKYFTSGVEVDLIKLKMHFDYTVDSRSIKTAADQKKLDRLTNFAFDASYAISGVLTPFVSIAQYNRVQNTKDLSGNLPTSTPDIVTTDKVRENTALADNGLSWGLGVFGETQSDYFKPYFAVSGHRGKFLKDPGINDETEIKSDLIFKLGMLGEF